MKQFVIVTASEQDSLDVRVSFSEYEDLTAAYKDNGLDADGETGYGIEFCDDPSQHAPGQLECDYCSKSVVEERSGYSTTIVLEVPPIGSRGESAYFTNG